MRFCPNCGAALIAGAKFCVECGRPLEATASASAGVTRHPDSPGRKFPLTTAFTAVFLGITVVGLSTAAYIVLRTPQAAREEASSRVKGSTAVGQLPPGHPRIQLPTEARSFIDKIEKEAKAKPDDIDAWNKLGTVSMRAAMFDQTYYSKAEQAYSRVLKLDPDNLEALRGIGDINYDRHNYDRASAAYEHYLKLKPDDPQVMTDLGTMYLYTGNSREAIAEYKKAIAAKPAFFQAYYNMGIAYGHQGDQQKAEASFLKALKLAPDENVRKQVREMMVKVGLKPIAAPTAQSSPKARLAKPAQTSSPPQPVASAKTFHGAVEKMLRSLPVAGPKVGSLTWSGKLKARLMMNNFPMEAMPEFAKGKFLSNIKSGIRAAKKDFKVADKVELEIVDRASGRVMDTVTE